MKTKADVRRILRAGKTAAEGKAYLPVNMAKPHPKDMSLTRLLELLKKEVVELEEAIVTGQSSIATTDEAGDVIYIASMIAYKMRGV